MHLYSILMLRETEPMSFPGRPEMSLPINHEGFFVGRPADNYGNFHFEGFIVKGIVKPFDKSDTPLKVIEVLVPPDDEFTWKRVMLDSFFEITGEDLSAKSITREEQNSLWDEYQKSERYLNSFPQHPITPVG